MTNVSEVIRTTSLEQSQATYPLPPSLLTGIHLFEKAHVIYRNVRYSQIFQDSQANPHQSNPFLLGATLSTLAPLTEVTSYALQVALITKCVNDITNQYEQLYNAYCDFQDAFYNRYPVESKTFITYEKSLDSYEDLTYISSSFKRFYEEDIKTLSKKIYLICISIGEIFFRIVRLSMCLQDARLLTEKDAGQHLHACTELVDDWQRYSRKIQADNKALLTEMNNNSLLADTILTKMDSHISANALLNNLREIVGQIYNHPVVRNISTSAVQNAREMCGGSDTLLVPRFTPEKKALGQDFSTGGPYPLWAGQKVPLQIQTNSPYETLRRILTPTSKGSGASLTSPDPSVIKSNPSKSKKGEIRKSHSLT